MDERDDEQRDELEDFDPKKKLVGGLGDDDLPDELDDGTHTSEEVPADPLRETVSLDEALDEEEEETGEEDADSYDDTYDI